MTDNGAKNIILVEDDPALTRLMTHCLERAGFRVESIGDGREALDLPQRDTLADLVIVDYLMPYANGLKVTRALRADPRWQVVPIICVTEISSEDTMIDGLRLRSDGFMTKPIDPGELVGLARRLMRRTPVPDGMAD